MEEELELYGFGNWLIGVLIILLKFSMNFQQRFFMVRKLLLSVYFRCFDWQDFVLFSIFIIFLWHDKFLTMNIDWSTQVNGSKHVIIMRNFEVDRQPEAHGTQGFSFQYCSLDCSSFPIDFCFYGYAV